MEVVNTRDQNRPRHTDLKPLATGLYPYEGQNMQSPANIETPSTTAISPSSVINLATPSLAQVRKNYKDHSLQTAFQASTSPMIRNHSMSQEASKRTSMISPNALVSRMESVVVTTPSQGLLPRYVRGPITLAEQSREMLLKGVGGTELAKLSGLTTNRRNSLFRTSSSLLVAGQFSTDSIHHQLRDIGTRYIGDAATADIFVNAVQLRRSRRIDEPGTITAHPNVVVIRARVLPRAKERRPFLMQRRFNLDEMQAASPVRNVDAEIVGADKPQANDLIPAKKYEDASSPAPPRSTSNPCHIAASSMSSPARPSAGRIPAMIPGSGGRRITIMPIHVDYALHYLPVLAALMVSGHIRKGDGIDLPLPHPESWQEVVSYIYTGQGRMTRGMEANIVYLGGRLE